MEPHASRPDSRCRAGILLVAAYVLLRMVADPLFWREISAYYSYAFEIAFVLVAAYVFWDRVRIGKPCTRRDAVSSAVALGLGFLAYRGAGWVGIQIPFDFSSLEVVFLLLVLAPLLEEAVFRLALWEAISATCARPWVVLLATTLLFSGGHFAAYGFVPEEYRSFVLYQAAYVVLLGLGAGWRRLESGAVGPAIAVHFCFNLGFLVASRF